MKYTTIIICFILTNVSIAQSDTLANQKVGYFAISYGYGNHVSFGHNAINDAYHEDGQFGFSLAYTSQKINASVGLRQLKYQIIDPSIFGETSNKMITLTEFQVGYRLDLLLNKILLIPKLSFGISKHHTQSNVDGVFYGGNVEGLWNVYKAIGIFGEIGYGNNLYNYRTIPTKYESYYDNSSHFYFDLGLKILLKEKI